MPRRWLAMMRPSFISWIQSHASAIAGLCVASSSAFPRSCTRFSQQLKGALGICGVEIACRFVGQNDAADRWPARARWRRVVVRRRKDDDWAVAICRPSLRLRARSAARSRICFIRKLAKLAHRDHHVFLRSEILHQKMELENEPDELAPFVCASSSSLRCDIDSDSIET